MINNIRFKDEDDKCKNINIFIDNANETLPVKEIDKFQTYINLNKSIDTALYENIEIDAFLYHYGYYTKFYSTYQEAKDADPNYLDNELYHIIIGNNSYNENDVIIKPNNVDVRRRAYARGLVYISIFDDNFSYYEKTITIENGIINLSIPNNFKAGKYNILIKFLGNEYYSNSEYQSVFYIKKRPIKCIFEHDKYYADAGTVKQLSAQIIDTLNNKSINNYTFQYSFNGETNSIDTDSSGNIIINALIPNPDKSHCDIHCKNNAYNDTGYIDEDGVLHTTEPEPPESIDNSQSNRQVIYPLIVSLLDDESYELEDTKIQIIVKKIPTETIITNFVHETEDDRAFSISGYIKADTTTSYARYGLVNIALPNNNYIDEELCIDEYGHFEKQILMSEIDNVAANTGNGQYEIINDKMKTYIEAPENININVEDFIEVTAHVRQNGDKIVDAGVITFILKENGKDKHTYMSEVDASGSATFNFLATKSGAYTVYIKYCDRIFEYEDSEAEVQVTVNKNIEEGDE